MRNAMNELNAVVNIMLDECAKFNDVEFELNEIIKLIRIVNPKDADSLELQWNHLNIDHKSELLDEIYTRGIHFENTGFSSHQYIKSNHLVENIYAAFPYISPVENTVDHYIADSTLPTNSISGLKYELMNTSSRQVQNKGWSIGTSMDRLKKNTGFIEDNRQIKSIKTTTKKVSFSEPRFVIEFEHKGTKNGKPNRECAMYIKAYFPDDESTKRRRTCTVFNAVAIVSYKNDGNGYKPIAEKLAYLTFIEYMKSFNKINTYFNDDTYLTCELRDIKRDSRNKIKRIG